MFQYSKLCDRGGSFCQNRTIAKTYFTLLSEFNPFQPSVAFLYPIQTSENLIPPENIRKPYDFLMFSRGYRKPTPCCNGLKF